MTSQSFAGLLGTIAAIAVLGAAVYYGPIGQFGKPPKPAAIAQPTQPVPAAPVPRGPVIREVPN
jgi:phage gpG-like protein